MRRKTSSRELCGRVSSTTASVTRATHLTKAPVLNSELRRPRLHGLEEVRYEDISLVHLRPNAFRETKQRTLTRKVALPLHSCSSVARGKTLLMNAITSSRRRGLWTTSTLKPRPNLFFCAQQRQLATNTVKTARSAQHQMQGRANAPQFPCRHNSQLRAQRVHLVQGV